MTWSDHDVVRLRTLAEDGLTAEIIGIRLGVSKSAVIGKCYRLGIPLGGSRGPISPRRREAAARQAALREEKLLGMPVSTRAKCAWINGHPVEPGWSFCGQPVETDKPYCPDHCARAYKRVTETEAAAEAEAAA